MECGGLFGLLGGEAPTDDEASFVEAEVEGGSVERERAQEEREEAGIGEAAGGGRATEEPREEEEDARREHGQPGHEVDVRMADRIDPLACMAGTVEPVRLGGLDLNHALHRPNRQPGSTHGDELP